MQLTIGTLIVWCRDNILKERPELFMKDNTVYGSYLLVLCLLQRDQLEYVPA